MNSLSSNRIWQLRAQHNVRQADLARALGISRNTLIAIEEGHTLPTLRIGLDMARILGCAVEDLFCSAKAHSAHERAPRSIILNLRAESPAAIYDLS